MGRLKGAAFVAVLVAAIVAGARADVIGGANVRVTFRGWLTPRTLPRRASAPVTLHVRGGLKTTNGREPPVLERVTIEINHLATVSVKGIPLCRRGAVEATTTAQALARCRSALIGTGTFAAHIRIPDEAPFPAKGRLLAFNAVDRGRHVILAHVFGRQPVPTGQVLTLTFQRPSRGTFGTVLSMDLPELAAGWGHVTGFSLTLHRRFHYRGHWRSLISASCPAPSGFESAIFPAARGSYLLGDGRVITRLVTGRCRAA